MCVCVLCIVYVVHALRWVGDMYVAIMVCEYAV